MKITKILNNNVVLTLDEKQEEMVVMGRGLAFGLKVNDMIDEAKIDKTFKMEKADDMSRFALLLSQMEFENFEFVESIINCIKYRLGKKINNSLTITLCDHINTLKERAEIGAYIKNTMLWDIRRLYKDEFNCSMEVVEKINKFFNAKFDENEAATITLHIVNAEMDMNLSQIFDITQVMSEIMNIVKYQFKIEYDENSLTYYRFVTHLRCFAQRVFTHSAYDSNGDNDLFEFVKKRYDDAFKCTINIKAFIAKAYQYVLEDEECLYLTIHIAKVVRESESI